jgi:2-keto-4-pentenoate hydratase/2-oxohepta-3-ene-1,7-dioic acid hydratase in catechol pathway
VKLVVFERVDAGSRRGLRRASDGSHSMGAAALGFESLEGVALGQRRIGVLLEGAGMPDAVVDLNRALAVKLAAEDAGAPEAEADSLLPSRIERFLQRLPDSGHAARAALSFVEWSLGRYDAPDLEAAGVVMPRRAVRLASPVERPGKLVGVLSEDGEPPALFLLAPSAIAGPEDELPLPGGMEICVDPQVAAVIGRRTRCVAPEHALERIAGYCAALGFHAAGPGAPPGSIRFSGDGFVALGPALVTADEAPEPHDLRVGLRVSGRRQRTLHTKELPLPMHELVARASELMTLEPGDVVLSGAPRDPSGEQARLREGDVVEAEVERLGRLSVYLTSPGRGPRDQTGV